MERQQQRQHENTKGESRIVAFCGTRGIPANYGGFETAVDEISRRFVSHGIPTEVFCRLSQGEKQLSEHEGRRLVYVAGSKKRTLDTFVSSIQTGWHIWRHRKRYAHVFWFNNANLPGILLTWLARVPMSVNTDGLEWRRQKWSLPFKAYYYFGSFVISRLCKRLISDSRAIQKYYKRHFFKETTFIPYGCPKPREVSSVREREILSRFKLTPKKYFLQITRIEPDNLPLAAAKSFQEARLAEKGFKMVLVGYKEPTPYAQRLISYNGTYGVAVHEAVYDQEVLTVLRNNCYCYVHGNSVGGTNPALLEAMASCPRIMAIDCEFSREVLGDLGVLFDPQDITPTFEEAMKLPDQSEALRRRVTQNYRWDAVAQSYLRLAEGKGPVDYPALLEEMAAVLNEEKALVE